MSQQNKITLQQAINAQLADNTAGDISAADIRSTIINVTDSTVLNNGDQGITGSLEITGDITASAFIGDGSALTNITAEWDGSHNGNADITGSLIISGSNANLIALNKIAIGTDNPTADIHVKTEASPTILLEDTTNSATLEIKSTNDNQTITSTGKLILNTPSGLTITGDGKVGVGTTTPVEPLTVEGSISGSGNLNITGDITGSSFTGSFIGDGSELSGVLGEEKRMDYTQLNVSSSQTVAYLNVMGQSNADGTQEYPTGEQMSTELTNVYHLKRSSAVASNGQFGEWTDSTTWQWSNFISTEENNLCRRSVGQYKNGTTEFAKKWQARIDGGEELPDLYITHFSYSGNGFHKDDATGTKSRFNPFEAFATSRENIWHGTQKLHRWSLENLLAANTGVVHLGILYNQWEHDSQDATAAINHRSWVQALLLEHDKISGIRTPLTYYVPSTDGFDGRFLGWETCKAGFEDIKDRLTVAINPRELAAYDTSVTTMNGYYGIYHDDVHYNLGSHTLLAEQMYTKEMYKGILITSTTITDLVPYALSTEVAAAITLAAPKTLHNANEYVGDDTIEIDLPNVTQLRSGTDRKEWRVSKESDGKKYFKMNNRGSQFFFSFFEGLPSDTQFGSFDMRFQAGSRISIGVVIGVNSTTASTYKDTGKNYIAIGLACDSDNQRATASTYAMRIWRMAGGATALGEATTSNTGLPLGIGTSGCSDDVDIRIQVAPGNSSTTRTFTSYYKLTTSNTYVQLMQLSNFDVSTADADVLLGGGMGIISGLNDLTATTAVDTMRIKTFELISDE